VVGYEDDNGYMKLILKGVMWVVILFALSRLDEIERENALMKEGVRYLMLQNALLEMENKELVMELDRRSRRI
jgi:hypothetical protein